MANLRWPDQRADIINGLEALATLHSASDPSREWPDLGNAVHWVVDDTRWDERPPDNEIGQRLRDQPEVDAVKAVLTPLLQVLDDIGPSKPDPVYFRHRVWRDIERSAKAASSLMNENDAKAVKDR